MKPEALIITCERAVNTVPREYMHLFAAHPASLQLHRSADFAALTMTNNISLALACDSVVTKVSHLLIDCNHSLSHPECFSKFTKSLSKAEKQILINEYYLPFRQRVEDLIKNHIMQGRQILHLSIHSFIPKATERNLDIGFLYDPRHHGEKEVIRIWRGLILKQSPLSVIGTNDPIPGTRDSFISFLRTQYEENTYLGIELKVNQHLLKSKTTRHTMIELISSTLRELCQLL